MNLDQFGQALLLVDLVAVGGFAVYALLDLRRQTSDAGRVGGAVALMSLCYVFYFVGRALLGV